LEEAMKQKALAIKLLVICMTVLSLCACSASVDVKSKDSVEAESSTSIVANKSETQLTTFQSVFEFDTKDGHHCVAIIETGVTCNWGNK
jgi:hypothetical protein